MKLLVDPGRSVYLFGARKHFSLCFYTFIQLNGVRENVFLAPTGNFYVADLLTRVRPGTSCGSSTFAVTRGSAARWPSTSRRWAAR